jgi:hypothetical protein
MRADRFLLEAGNRKYDTLAAGLYVLQLPQQFLDIVIGSLRLEPRQARLLEVVLHRFPIDHGIHPLNVARFPES